MHPVANLYRSIPTSRPSQVPRSPPAESAYDKRKREEREAKEAKRKAKEDRRDQEMRERIERNRRDKRTPFNFEKEKPQILQAIAETSQASNNLINALMVNCVHAC
jgi:LAS seventeen-binding protein 5